MFQQVLDTGEATWSDDQLLVLQRFGYVEEAYFTWSFSAICSDSGNVDGVFTAVFETTGRVLSERRLVTLRELGANATAATGIEEACDRFIETLKQNPSDVPFALIYLLDEKQKTMRFKSALRVPEGHGSRIAKIDLDGSPQPWPIADALISKKPIVVRDLRDRFSEFPGARWPESPRQAVVLSIPGTDLENPIGALVIGVNPRRALDNDYEGFLQLVAGQFSTALNNARSYEKERQRAEALAELDRAKTTFFSNVSHEFRTPLTLMLGPLEETLAESHVLPAETRERLEIAHSNSVRLLKLVNTLLDFSRIEAGRIEASYEPTDLALYTRELASVFRSAMEKARLHYRVDCPPLPEPVYVDREMWEKIIFNLLSNAFKFTFQGEVSVALRCHYDRVELIVSDTGEGIPPEELPRVFDRFHRVRATRSRSYEGTGIGLALVRELVRLHGGEVRVESVAGRGTTFTVSVPTGTAHLPKDRIAPAPSTAHVCERSSPFVDEVLRWLPDSGPKLQWPLFEPGCSHRRNIAFSQIQRDYGRPMRSPNSAR
jgi:signal transduction histidine kinase